jgi:transposase
VSLAQNYDYVVGGDPDRDTIDLAVVDTATGGVRAHVADSADGPGYQRLLTWARQQAPGRRLWALEGTGSFAAGLVAALADAGEEVAEVPGGKPTRGAKNDQLDAIRAARTALARNRQIQPRAAGLREALRQVAATREAVLVSRTKAINELKSLIVVAPDSLRAVFARPGPARPPEPHRRTPHSARCPRRAPGDNPDPALNRRQDQIPDQPDR